MVVNLGLHLVACCNIDRIGAVVGRRKGTVIASARIRSQVGRIRNRVWRDLWRIRWDWCRGWRGGRGRSRCRCGYTVIPIETFSSTNDFRPFSVARPNIYTITKVPCFVTSVSPPIPSGSSRARPIWAYRTAYASARPHMLLTGNHLFCGYPCSSMGIYGQRITRNGEQRTESIGAGDVHHRMGKATYGG